MTRENKVALVVGFALVLLAGVLISDHFSKARFDRPAELAVHQTAGAGVGSAMGELIDLSSYFRADDAEPAPEAALRSQPPAEPPAFEPVAAGPAPPAPAVTAEKSPGDSFAPGPERRDDPAARVHEVQPGESMSLICQRYYHDQSLIDELARLNDIDDLDHLRAGTRLRVPPAPELTGKRAAPADPGGAGAGRTHAVQPGETLSRIAARELGTTARWRELLELNRDVIDDPDLVEAGVILKLPPSPAKR